MAARSWRREPMVWLVIALPLLTVVAGLATAMIAAQGPPDRMDANVRRVAQVQTSDLAPDLAAAARGVEGEIAFERRDGRFTLRIVGAPDADLQLWLRHPGDARRDLRATLLASGDGHYVAALGALGAGPWNLTLSGDDGAWRVTGRLAAGANRATLLPAVRAR
jgi:hypothetical protein